MPSGMREGVVRTPSRTVVTTLVLALATAMSPLPVAASTPQPITITTVVSYQPQGSFTWSASGAFTDAGTLELGFPQWGGVPSPVVGTLHVDLRLKGSRGTIDLKTE